MGASLIFLVWLQADRSSARPGKRPAPASTSTTGPAVSKKARGGTLISHKSHVSRSLTITTHMTWFTSHGSTSTYPLPTFPLSLLVNVLQMLVSSHSYHIVFTDWKLLKKPRGGRTAWPPHSVLPHRHLISLPPGEQPEVLSSSKMVSMPLFSISNRCWPWNVVSQPDGNDDQVDLPPIPSMSRRARAGHNRG